VYLVFEVGVSDAPTFLIIYEENSMSKKLHSPKAVQASPKGDHAAKHPSDTSHPHVTHTDSQTATADATSTQIELTGVHHHAHPTLVAV
jgi:hypothetical protein